MIKHSDRVPAMMDYKPGEIMTPDYFPTHYYGAYWFTNRKPYFTLRWVRYMLDDSRVRFGLWTIKGPIIANTKVTIQAQKTEVSEFIRENVDRFWANSAVRALRAIEYGYSGSEALYFVKDGQVHFSQLKVVQPWDARCLTQRGALVGMVTRRSLHHVHKGRIYLWGPKAFWHVHMGEEQPFYGVSRLRFAYPYWFDKVKTSGSLDALSLFFYKYAIAGARVYYPPKSRAKVKGQGLDYEGNKSKANELANSVRTGGTMVIPNERDENGNRLWEVEEAKNTASGEELINYQDLLDGYIFQAMGIPSELIEAGATGSGYAGRRVPAQAFYSTLQELADKLLWDFDTQILRRMVYTNFGPDTEYHVSTQPLLRGDADASNDEETETQAGGGGVEPSPGGGLSTSTLTGASGSAVTAPRFNPHQ